MDKPGLRRNLASCGYRRNGNRLSADGRDAPAVVMSGRNDPSPVVLHVRRGAARADINCELWWIIDHNKQLITGRDGWQPGPAFGVDPSSCPGSDGGPTMPAVSG